MVSIKSLTVLTLSISAAAAIPQYQHAHFHRALTDAGTSGEVGVGQLVQEGRLEGRPHRHHKGSQTNNTVIATPAPDLNTQARRWDRTRTRGPAVASPLVDVSVGINVGASTTATAPATDATSATNITTAGGKKGLSYNTNSLLDHFNGAGASWAYNWASGPGGAVPAGVEYVPMCWGQKSLGDWATQAQKAIASGSTHLLSFNEPDFPEQANMDAATAAKLHITNVAAFSGQAKIGSPAISNSNIAGQGLDWMRSFLAACGGAANNCKIDFLAFHWYNNPGTIADFKSHTQTIINLAKTNGIPKVWLTEFAVNGGASDQAAFLAEALPFLDSQPEVERYAYFMVGNGQMLTNNALNVVGKAYSG